MEEDTEYVKLPVEDRCVHKVTELEAEFEKVKGEKVTPIRFLKSQQQKQAKLAAEAAAGDAGDLRTPRFYYNLGHDYFRMKCLRWQELPHKVKMQPSLVQIPYASPIGTSNLDGSLNMKLNNDANNQTLPDSTANFQEEAHSMNQEVVRNSPFSNDCNLFVHKSIEKPSLNKYGVTHESALWQSSQNRGEMRYFPNPFRDCGKGTKNSTEEDNEKITNTQVRTFEQNVARLQETNESQPNEDVEAGSEPSRGEKAAAQGGTSVMYAGYNMTPASVPLPCSYPAVSPTFYNNTVYPMLVPVDTEQGIIPMLMYPYSVGATTVPSVQEVAETASTAENQCSASVCAPVQHSAVGIDNSCMPSYAFYTQPPAPLLFASPSLSPPAGLYSGVGQMQRWAQPNINAQAPPCVYPSQTPLPYTASKCLHGNN